MTEKRVRCDHCGKPAIEVRYNYRRESDGAGGMETNYDTIDLCHAHVTEGLMLLLAEPPKAPAECKDAFKRWAKQAHWKPEAGA